MFVSTITLSSWRIGRVFGASRHIHKWRYVTCCLAWIPLKRKGSGRYRYFYGTEKPSPTPPRLISNKKSLTKFASELKAIDLHEDAKQHAPDSAWEPYDITNVLYHVYPTTFTMGRNGMNTHMLRSSYFFSLTTNCSRRPYADNNLSAFRALAYHQNNHSLYPAWGDVEELYMPLTWLRGILGTSY